MLMCKGKKYNSFSCSDLAREKGHIDCATFLDNPVQHMKKMKKHSGGGLTMERDQQASGGNELLNRSFKKRRSFSFLGRIKVKIVICYDYRLYYYYCNLYFSGEHFKSMMLFLIWE